MFISFVLIQVKRTKEKSQNLNGTLSFYTIHTHNRRDMTSVLSDGTQSHNVIHLW
ncbi:MAG: hypothetical protein J7K51_00195 [Thermotogae bacterium]|nr:hypothetical protein [Thermotogota bacterium]